MCAVTGPVNLLSVLSFFLLLFLALYSPLIPTGQDRWLSTQSLVEVSSIEGSFSSALLSSVSSREICWAFLDNYCRIHLGLYRCWLDGCDIHLGVLLEHTRCSNEVISSLQQHSITNTGLQVRSSETYVFYIGKNNYVNQLELPGFLHWLDIKCDLIAYRLNLCFCFEFTHSERASWLWGFCGTVLSFFTTSVSFFQCTTNNSDWKSCLNLEDHVVVEGKWCWATVTWTEITAV